MKRNKKQELKKKADIRAAWRKWIAAEVTEGRNRNEAESMAIIFQLCKIFEISPQEFGVCFWPGGKPLGTTMKTGYILASLVLALICDRVEDPPSKNGTVAELLKTLPAAAQAA